jgi:hypothetical protein
MTLPLQINLQIFRLVNSQSNVARRHIRLEARDYYRRLSATRHAQIKGFFDGLATAAQAPANWRQVSKLPS